MAPDPKFERCRVCEEQERFGMTRCTACGIPLSPSEAALQGARKIYLKIRTFSHPELKFYGDVCDGKVYYTVFNHANVQIFLASDWVALDYGLRVRSNHFPEDVKKWRTKLEWWRHLQPGEKANITDNSDYWHEPPKYLAEYPTGGTLAVAKLILGDWFGHFLK